MAAAAVAVPPAVPQLAHASTSSSAPAHTASHHSRTARTQLFVHAAGNTPSLVVRGADHAAVHALAFPEAQQHDAVLDALACGEGGGEVGPLVSVAVRRLLAAP